MTAISVVRLQRLLVLFFLLAVFGIGFNLFKEKSEKQRILESAKPAPTEQVLVNQEYS